jgi:thymidylate synthase
MHLVHARNVNDALLQGLNIFRSYRNVLREVNPRGSRRLEIDGPFITVYRNPRERVLFHPVRDANPFFHFMESLWILNGRADVAWLAQWLPSIAEYSDDGQIFHGAYGQRLHHTNQIGQAIKRLCEEPDGNRCVLQIYAASRDAGYTGKDMPCNTTVYLLLREGYLDLTVCNRSNDLIWGTYGANVVQFSMLQEYIASSIGAKCGTYYQFSNNTHIYPDNPATKRCFDLIEDVVSTDPYELRDVHPFNLMQSASQWETEIWEFMDKLDNAMYSEPFFEHVAVPMASAHRAYRAGELEVAHTICGGIAADDWRLACKQWLERRMEKRNAQTQGLLFKQNHWHGEADAAGEAR